MLLINFIVRRKKNKSKTNTNRIRAEPADLFAYVHEKTTEYEKKSKEENKAQLHKLHRKNKINKKRQKKKQNNRFFYITRRYFSYDVRLNVFGKSLIEKKKYAFNTKYFKRFLYFSTKMFGSNSEVNNEM